MVEVSYEVAAADKFGEHILVQYRHGAAENAQFFAENSHKRGRQNHISYPNRRRKSLGEGVDVN